MKKPRPPQGSRGGSSLVDKQVGALGVVILIHKKHYGTTGQGRRVQQIAEAVGYTSDASFRRAFKKITGVSPVEYREK